jgi:hypothetical protein
MAQATFAADIGKGVALGLRALGGPMAAAQAQSATKEVEEKTRYSDDDIAAIKWAFRMCTAGGPGPADLDHPQ